MIAGATRGSGGSALANHLGNEAKNESVLAGPSRGLVSDPKNARAQQRELEQIQAHARTAKPIHHVHADPPIGLTPDKEAAVRERFWQHYEKEFGLERQPFYSRVHQKDGRNHEHRVYGLGRPDGSVIDLSFDFARREKVSRTVEVEMGLPLVKGAHNRAVMSALERDGRQDIADVMRAGGLHEGPRPVADLSPGERAQQERTKVTKADVATAVAEAWRNTSDGKSFESSLADQGFRLMQGDKAVMVVDETGNVHGLRRMLAMASKADGSASVTAKEISGRIDGLTLDQAPTPAPGRAREIAPEHYAVTADNKDSAPSVPVTPVAAEAVTAQPVTAAPTQEGSDQARPDKKQIEEIQRAIDQLIERWRATAQCTSAARRYGAAADLHLETVREIEAEGLGNRGPAQSEVHDGRSPGRDAQGTGHARDVAGDVRSDHGSTPNRQPATAPVVARTQGGGIEDRRSGVGNRKGSGHTETDYRRPGRNEINAAQARAESGRIEIALQAQGTALQRVQKKTSELIGPADLAAQQQARAAAAWKESKERIERVLSTEPFKDPASRLAKHIADELSDLHRSKFERFRSEAATAREQFADAIKQVGILDRLARFLTIITPAIRATDFAKRQAEATRVRFEAAADAYEHERYEEQSRAFAIALSRQAQHNAWERRPEVKRAIEERVGNELVKVAILSGDTSIQNLANQNLAAARHELFQRKAAETAKITRQSNQEIAQPRSNNGPPPASSGPRRR